MKKLALLLLAATIIIAGCQNKKKENNTYPQYQKLEQDTVSVKIDTVVKEIPAPVQVEEKHPFDLSNNYFLVINSFVIPENAKKHFSKLKEDGFEPGIFMVNNDGYYKLAVESYKKYEDAEKAKTKIANMGSEYAAVRVVYKPSK